MPNALYPWQLTNLVYLHGASYPMIADLIEARALGDVPADDERFNRLHAEAMGIVMAMDHLAYECRVIRVEDFDGDALEEMRLVTAHLWEFLDRAVDNDHSLGPLRPVVIEAFAQRDRFILASIAAESGIPDESMEEGERLGWIQSGMRARGREINLRELPLWSWSESTVRRLCVMAELRPQDMARRTDIGPDDLLAMVKGILAPTKKQWRQLIEANYMDAALVRLVGA